MAAQPTDAQLQQWFAAIDTDGTGTINALELQRAMALGGLSFSTQACAQVGGPAGWAGLWESGPMMLWCVLLLALAVDWYSCTPTRLGPSHLLHTPHPCTHPNPLR